MRDQLTNQIDWIIISIYFILGFAALYKMMRDKEILPAVKCFGIIVLISVPIVLYNGWIVLTDTKLTEDSKKLLEDNGLSVTLA